MLTILPALFFPVNPGFTRNTGGIEDFVYYHTLIKSQVTILTMPTTPPPPIDVVILAAGSSSRLGKAKQLVRWQGQTLLERSVALATALTANIWLVLGARAADIKRECNLSTASVLEHKGWAEGMGSSLRFGIGQLPPESNGVLIMLCDQPRIPLAHYQTLVNSWSEQDGATAVATRYPDGRIGVPALFPASHYQSLRTLRSGQGAKAILADMPAAIAIPCPEAELDIDTAEDVSRLELE